MFVVGFFIIMGIGIFFGIIFIIVVFYVFLCVKLGFSIEFMILFIGIVVVLGDVGLLVSDSIMGFICGFNVDN